MPELIAIWVTAVATSVLAAAACVQLPLIARQLKALSEQVQLSRQESESAERRMREWETLKACQLYDFDPILEAATLRIYTASEGGKNDRNPEVQRRDIVVFLNYLDGLATGIQQKLYIEEVIHDHMHIVIEKAVTRFIHSGIIPEEGYERLVAMHRRWIEKGQRTAYESTRHGSHS